MYIHIVLEYPVDASASPKIHAVHLDRENADDQAAKLKLRHPGMGYIAVLKKRIKGV